MKNKVLTVRKQHEYEYEHEYEQECEHERKHKYEREREYEQECEREHEYVHEYGRITARNQADPSRQGRSASLEIPLEKGREMDYFVDFIALGIIYFIFFYRRWRREDKQKYMVKTLIYMYISFVLLFTLMPFFIPIPGGNNLFLQSMNLVPYRDVIKGIDGAIREAILNIIMLMPFGFLLPIVSKRNIAAIALFLFIFSISIELMQLLYVWSAGPTSRSFDVTDLINNTIGGMVGYLIFLVFRPFIHKLLKPNKVT